MTTTPTPIYISPQTLTTTLTHKTLIPHLKKSLPLHTHSVTTPPRHSHPTSQSSTLLCMPSFSISPSLPYIGVKLVTSHPNNSCRNLPGIHASYTLFDSLTGQTLALFDATELTLFRTSSVSGLASVYLSEVDSEVLVMVGAGSLAVYLIKAHLCVRPGIRRVIIWNRTGEKSVGLAEKLSLDGEFETVNFESSECLENAVRLADIVSCATNSEFEKGVIGKDGVSGNLVELINGEKDGRRNEKEVIVFKSVGSGIVDVLTAQLVYENVKTRGDEEH